MNTEFQNLPNIVSPKEVQTYFGISRSTTYRIFHDASFPAFHICYSSISTWGSCPGVEPKLSFPQPFDQKFYLIINLAVGGWFDPEANGIVDNTAFPADFEIDYIRVYQQHKA